MLDFTLLTYTKGLGVMLTENCEVFITGYIKIFKNIDPFQSSSSGPLISIIEDEGLKFCCLVF